MRDSIIFYRSFHEAIKELDLKSQAIIYNAIFEYSLNFNEIELAGLPKTIFTLIKPQLDANNIRYENGTRGGRKPNQQITKNKPKHNQTETKTEANVFNDNDNVNVLNDNVNAPIFEIENLETGKEIIKKSGPPLIAVEEYFWRQVEDKKQASEMALLFFNKHSAANWMDGHERPIKNWTFLAENFIINYKSNGKNTKLDSKIGASVGRSFVAD